MDRVEILLVLKSQGAAFGVVQAEEEWEPMVVAYLDKFGHMPMHCLDDAFAAWRRGEGEKNPLWATIFPRIDQLAPLADPFWLQERARQYRERRQKEGPRQFTDEERAEERRKMIEAGYLNPDGTVNLAPKVNSFPDMPRPRQNPQEMAAQLRRMAPEDDAGEVL